MGRYPNGVRGQCTPITAISSERNEGLAIGRLQGGTVRRVMPTPVTADSLRLVGYGRRGEEHVRFNNAGSTGSELAEHRGESGRRLMHYNELARTESGRRITRRLLGHTEVQSESRELELLGAAMQRELPGNEISERVVTPQPTMDSRVVELQPTGSGGDITGSDGQLRDYTRGFDRGADWYTTPRWGV